jgi:hypothetical protein
MGPRDQPGRGGGVDKQPWSLRDAVDQLGLRISPTRLQPLQLAQYLAPANPIDVPDFF